MHLFGSHLCIDIEEDKVLDNSWGQNLNIFLPFLGNSTETQDDLSKHTTETTNTWHFLVVAINFNNILSKNMLFDFTLLHKLSIDLFLQLPHLISLPLSFSSSLSLPLIFQFLLLLLFFNLFDIFFSMLLCLNSLFMLCLRLVKVLKHEQIWEFIEIIQLLNKLLNLLSQPRKHILLQYINLSPVGKESSVCKISIGVIFHSHTVFLCNCSRHYLSVSCDLSFLFFSFI